MKLTASALALVAMVGFPTATGAQGGWTAPPDREMLPRPEAQMPGPLISGVPGTQLPDADPFHLLMNSSEVQADLGLSRDQLIGLEHAARNFFTRLQELSQPQPGLTPEQAQAQLQAHLTAAKGMIARELRPEQLTRLQQIILQLEGLCLVTADKQLETDLNITPEQAREITQGCQLRAMQMRDAFRPPQNPSGVCAALASNRDRIQNIRTSAEQHLMSLLSPEQDAIFEQMIGKKLSLEPPKPPPECG